MFAIDFEYYDKNTDTYTSDTFECDKSYKEFENFLSDNDILNFKIIEIRPY